MQLGQEPCPACGKLLVHAKPSLLGRLVGADFLAFLIALPLVAFGMLVHYIGYVAAFALFAFFFVRSATRERRWVCVNCGHDRGPAPWTAV